MDPWATTTTTTPVYNRTFADTTDPDFVCEFDYSHKSTPVMVSVSPKEAKGATKLTITGTQFSAVDLPTVSVGASLCTGVSVSDAPGGSTRQSRCFGGLIVLINFWQFIPAKRISDPTY